MLLRVSTRQLALVTETSGWRTVISVVRIIGPARNNWSRDSTGSEWEENFMRISLVHAERLV